MLVYSNGTASLSTVRGRDLAKLSKKQRAEIVIDVIEHRKALDASLRTVAAECGVSVSYVYAVRRGLVGHRRPSFAEKRLAWARSVGPETVWDELILPMLG
jgi:hypothetical protein